MVCNEHKVMFKRTLKSGKLKATPARLNILEAFAHEHKPLSIGELKERVGGKTDLVTLYRNVGSLTGLGIINRVQLGENKNFYEYASQSHHHHLVCTSCGKIADVSACQISISPKTIEAAGFAKIKSHSLEFFGLCKKCIKK